MNTTIPSRHNEKTFRFYEPYIAEAIRQYPNPAIFDISNSGRAFSTFVCRFRDACEAGLYYEWKSKLFSRIELMTLHRNTIVTTIDGKVFVGQRSDLKRDTEAPKPELVIGSKPVFKFRKLLDLNDLTLICILIQNKVITTPINFKPNSIATIEVIERYDVDLDLLPDGSYNIT